MIRFEPTTDYALVKRVLTHPRIWNAIADDFSGSPEQFEPVDNLSTVGYLAVWEDNTLCGIFTFAYQNRICWEIHTALLPHCWGFKSVRIARALAGWIWDRTQCQRVVTTVDESNLMALRFAQNAGFEWIGRNEKSVLKGGVLRNRILYGISRPADSDRNAKG